MADQERVVLTLSTVTSLPHIFLQTWFKVFCWNFCIKKCFMMNKSFLLNINNFLIEVFSISILCSRRLFFYIANPCWKSPSMSVNMNTRNILDYTYVCPNIRQHLETNYVQSIHRLLFFWWTCETFQCYFLSLWCQISYILLNRIMCVCAILSLLLFASQVRVFLSPVFLTLYSLP